MGELRLPIASPDLSVSAALRRAEAGNSAEFVDDGGTPEFATWAMALIGLGLIGLGLRRPVRAGVSRLTRSVQRGRVKA